MNEIHADIATKFAGLSEKLDSLLKSNAKIQASPPVFNVTTTTTIIPAGTIAVPNRDDCCIRSPPKKKPRTMPTIEEYQFDSTLPYLDKLWDEYFNYIRSREVSLQKKERGSYRSDQKQRKYWSRRLPFFIYFEQNRNEKKEDVMLILQSQRDNWGIPSTSRSMGDKYIEKFRAYLVLEGVTGCTKNRFQLNLPLNENVNT